MLSSLLLVQLMHNQFALKIKIYNKIYIKCSYVFRFN
jgi:hypothetical protein